MHAQFAVTLVALAAVPFAAAGNANVCAKAPYKDLLVLSKYAPAEAFCTSKYPLPAVTTTVTVTAGGHYKRGSYPTTTTTKKPAPTTTTACTGYCSTFSSCTKQGGGFLSTLCSCIETPKTVTVTKTATTTKKTTTTTTKKTTTSAPTSTFTPKSHCAQAGQRNNGGMRCGCYYDTYCNVKYVGSIINSTSGVSQDECALFAGSIPAPAWEAAKFNYDDQTGQCDVLITDQSVTADPSEGIVGGDPVLDSIPCRSGPAQDPDKLGCGCVYEQDCYNIIIGTKLGDVQTSKTYGDCFAACDLAGSQCVGFNFDGNSLFCTLFSSIDSKQSSFAITSAVRTSCDKPCVKN